MKALAGIVGVLVLAATTLFLCLPSAKPPPAESLAALGPELGVAFPPSTKLVGVLRQNGMDDWIGAKVTMSRTEWPAFLASTSLDDGRMEPGEGGLLGPDQSFWDPHTRKDLRTGQVILGDKFRALNVGVADLEAPTVTVYVVNHGS